jgi:hypothetical protein
VSTLEKSVASTPLAWERRNSTQVGPSRRGAGGSPWRRRTVATLPLETVTPSFFNSPTMCRYPQRGFFFARHTMRQMVSFGSGGRPGLWCVGPVSPDGRRCQRRIVRA